MESLFLFVGLACSLVSLVCWIMVLIKMFQAENGVVLGIVGIICGIVAFVWGWMKISETGQKNVMIVWTLAIIGGAVFNILGGGYA